MHVVMYTPRDFPGGPVVETSPSNEGGARIPHALWPKTQNIKKKNRSNIVANSIKYLKNGPY